MKKYAFFAHFNRINMQRGDPRVWTIHFRGTCYQVEQIIFNVPTRTTYKPDGHQPRAKMRGMAAAVGIADGIAVVS
jgi:hypothetical protein